MANNSSQQSTSTEGVFYQLKCSLEDISANDVLMDGGVEMYIKNSFKKDFCEGHKRFSVCFDGSDLNQHFNLKAIIQHASSIMPPQYVQVL